MSRPRPARPRATARFARAVQSLEPRTLLSVQLVTDLNTTPGSSDPANAVQVNGVTLFVANDNVHGREVWRTDGTAAGTILLRDIVAGPDGTNPVLLGTAGNLAIFTANGSDLWQTDGTPQNTRAVSNGTPLSGYPPSVGMTGTIGTAFYYTSQNRLFRIRSGFLTEIALSQSFSSFTKVISSDTKLYLMNDYGQIWVSDGTTNGSYPLHPASGTITDLVNWNGTTYFSLNNSTTSRNELWKTQGTDATTTFVAALPAAAKSMIVSGSTLYFWAKGPFDTKAPLWKSDGTAAGTVAVATVPLQGGFSATPPTLTPSAGKVFFPDSTSTSPLSTPRLWVSDGTPAGTVMLSTAVSVRLPSPSDRIALLDVGGTLFFQGADATGGSELWKTDGTAANTVQVADLVPGATGSAPQMLAALGSRLLFSATDPQTGRELYSSDGTAPGTALVTDLNVGTDGSLLASPVALNGKLVLTVAGRLYVVPSPAAVPQPLPFADASIDASACSQLTRVGNLLYFRAAVRGRTGVTLCVTDGTSEGTRIVTTLTNAYDPTNFTAVGDRLFFTDGPYGNSSVYTSDGTDQGTVALAGGFAFISAGPTPNPYFAAAGNRFYFSAQIGTGGAYELWTSDGTSQGTARIVSFASKNFWVGQLTPANGRLYFVGSDSRLYQTDGTPAGTSVVGSGAYVPRGTAPDDSLLLVAADTPFTGNLLRLGPADAAPAQLADVVPANAPSAHLGNWLYFLSNGGQIWRTDGTPQGTTIAVTNVLGAADLTSADDRLYYTYSRAGLGRELYATDGTPGDEYLVADMIPGGGSPSIANLTAVDGTLYFTALDGVHGRELWRAANVDDLPPAAISPHFYYDVHPQRLSLTFTENLANTLTLDDWKLVDRATGRDVSNLLTSLTFNDPYSTAYTATLILAASLPNGDYRLILPAGAVADRAGNATTADISFDFFQLAGDLNRDRTVNFADLLVLAKNYNKTGVGYGSGDFTGDGTVNFADLLILAKNYGTTLPTPPPAPAPAPAAPALAAPTPTAATTTTARPKPKPVFSVTPPPPKRPPAPPKRPAPARKPR